MLAKKNIQLKPNTKKKKSEPLSASGLVSQPGSPRVQPELAEFRGEPSYWSIESKSNMY